MASQPTLNDTLDFIRTNLTTRQAAESMDEEALRNKPTNADIRRLLQETILTREPFTSTHQVMFCTVSLAAKVVTFAFEELLLEGSGTSMRFFKNSDEEVLGALLWEAEVGLDASGRKELKNNTIHVWVPHKPGVGNEDEEAHLGWHYVEWFKECLEVGNKKPRQLSFRYFKDVPFSDEPRVWNTSDNQVNSIAMAMMHLLGLRVAEVYPSDDKETRIQKLLQDDIVKGYCIAEWKVTDEDKPPSSRWGCCSGPSLALQSWRPRSWDRWYAGAIGKAGLLARRIREGIQFREA